MDGDEIKRMTSPPWLGLYGGCVGLLLAGLMLGGWKGAAWVLAMISFVTAVRFTIYLWDYHDYKETLRREAERWRNR